MLRAVNSLPIKHVTVALVLLLFLLPLSLSEAQTRYEFTPAISVSEVYDDNIDLEPENAKSDYITALSPSINLNAVSQKGNLALRYAPTFAWYRRESENDTVRHAGTLDFGRNLSQYLTFNLTDTYVRSEEPLETTEGIEGVRRTRQTYDRNNGSASFEYQFGPEDTLRCGYSHSLLKNEDPTLDDGTIQNPFAQLTFWFNKRNGVDLRYNFSKASFSRDDGLPAEDDYTGHAGGIQYSYRFSELTRWFIGYDYTSRNFERFQENYKVHEGWLGFENTLSPHVYVYLQGGYFLQQREVSDDEDGYSGDASLVTTFQRGSFSLGAHGGWEETYLQAENIGFVEFRSGDARIDYRLLENLRGYAVGSYRWNEDEDERNWKTWRGNCGLRLEILRWFYLALDYTYVVRDDDVDTDDFRNNRVSLTFGASKLYRW